jgi:hypothetical protein
MGGIIRQPSPTLIIFRFEVSQARFGAQGQGLTLIHISAQRYTLVVGYAGFGVESE